MIIWDPLAGSFFIVCVGYYRFALRLSEPLLNYTDDFHLPMTSKLLRKFNSQLDTIADAIEGVSDLRDDFKLYNKIYRYYSRTGVIFTGDTSVDYTMILNYLYEDLSN